MVGNDKWELCISFIDLIYYFFMCFRTYFPWPLDKQCQNFTTVFSNNQPLPPVALASNPNSGNTWLRYLIEGITGIFTGSFYGDLDLARKGMLFDNPIYIYIYIYIWYPVHLHALSCYLLSNSFSGFVGESLPYDSGLTSVIKTHGSTTNQGTTSDHMMWTEQNAILLIRNPYKAIYGHRHLDAGGHVGFTDSSHFIGPGTDSKCIGYNTYKINVMIISFITYLFHSFIVPLICVITCFRLGPFCFCKN